VEADIGMILNACFTEEHFGWKRRLFFENEEDIADERGDFCCLILLLAFVLFFLEKIDYRVLMLIADRQTDMIRASTRRAVIRERILRALGGATPSTAWIVPVIVGL